ncbi:D-beta-hydroxybutyrate dehydrogenase, mitochondrial-like [Penaeus japonicus]|uniref:D-beta-hydroxybutyrate dehydrogenase, mitochondrial-like n=1 Tax=Penaeus japonicus TaxID=27405 RepID=UPI001C70F3E0|nr:D-beta-hydroxybutyrate dehydrogenase, mitochondrial-like [Penaeus japonicus]
MRLTLDTTADMLFLGCAGTVAVTAASSLGITEGLGCSLRLLVAVWTIAPAACLAFTRLKISASGKAVLVTGCDSGFGYQLALYLDRIGFRVFAGCLRAESQGEGAEKLRIFGSSKLHVLQLDVTKRGEVKSARRQIQALLQQGEVLWGLVNNAGVTCLGLAEWATVDRYKQTADVNIFGMVAVTQTFLPLIKQSRGRIVNVGSMVGRLPQPFFTGYVVTKYAVEGFSDCLRVEMRPWRVKVSVIEPGNFAKATGFGREEELLRQEEELWANMDDDLRQECPRQKLEQSQALRVFRKVPKERYMPMDLHTFVRIFVATPFP